MSNTLKFGNGQWATKDGSVLAYNDENDNFKPLPFNFERASSATLVNKDGLIEQVGSGEPRIDYTDSAEGAMLLEGQSTNLITRSEDFANGSTNSVLYTANTTETISPSGNNTADKFEVTASNEDSNTRLTQTIAIQSFTLSVYVKGNEGQKFQLFLARDSYAEIKSINVTLSGGWQRIVLSDSFSTNSSSVVIGYEFGWGADDSVAGQVYYLWGAQLENQSYATSYIPTNGSVATRLADVCTNGANEQVINSSEGVLYAEIAALDVDDLSRYITLTDGVSNSNGIRILYHNSNFIFFQKYVNGVRTTNINTTSVVKTDFNKIAIRYNLTEVSVFVNGVNILNNADTNTFSADLNNLSFDINGFLPFFGKTKAIAVYKEALTDAELQSLTS